MFIETNFGSVKRVALTRVTVVYRHLLAAGLHPVTTWLTRLEDLDRLSITDTVRVMASQFAISAILHTFLAPRVALFSDVALTIYQQAPFAMVAPPDLDGGSFSYSRWCEVNATRFDVHAETINGWASRVHELNPPVTGNVCANIL